jgi:5-methylcytosine-specific restriction endonuclease McrA
MTRRKVKLVTGELRAAFALGQRAKRKGEALRSNPYRPCSDGDLWSAWNRGFQDHGTSKQAMARRNRVKAVVAAHGEICWLCHKPINGDLTMDHVVPRSKGGRANRDNLRPAHELCNSKRGNGPPPELVLRTDMMLSPRSKPTGGNSTQFEVPCEARERDQRQLQAA